MNVCMKIIKVICGILLLIVPIGLSTSDSSDTTYVMTPLGAAASKDNKVEYGFFSFNWLSEDGRVDYAKGITFDTWPDINRGEFYASQWIYEVDDEMSLSGFYANLAIVALFSQDTDMSTAGVITTLMPLLILAFIILCFVPGSAVALVADGILLFGAILTLIAFLDFRHNFGANYDSNVPLFTIISFIMALVFGYFSFKNLNNKKSRRRRR